MFVKVHFDKIQFRPLDEYSKQIQVKRFYWFLLVCVAAFVACDDMGDFDSNQDQPIIMKLIEDYSLLPEQAITVSEDSSIFAQYAMPTTKYSHTILGDGIEAEQLVVAINERIYEVQLEEDYVFEDIRPRLYDVDNDNELEIITLRTHVDEGAGVVIYKLENEALIEYAIIEEIGTPFRWLNIAAIDDLDNDGIVEILWVETPHIGGTLKVAKIERGTLDVLASTREYSNHAIGERNLCLSVTIEQNNQKVVYVPNQNRDRIHGFVLENNELVNVDVVDEAIDFSRPLHAQYEFENVVEDEVNCIQ